MAFVPQGFSGGPPPVNQQTRPGYGVQYINAPRQLPVLGGYYANWAVYQNPPFAPSRISYYHINTLLYAFAKLAPSGEVSLSDPWGDIEKPFEPTLGTPEFDPGFKGNLGEIAILKRRNPSLRCQLSIGGAGDEVTRHFRSVISSPASRKSFARTSVSLCSQYGFDGLDVDFEHPKNEAEGRGLLELLREVRREWDATVYRMGRGEMMLLSVATSMSEWSAQWLPLREMDEVLDRVYLMTYDASGSWEPTLGHQAPLHGPAPSVETTVDYYTSRGMPVHKLVLGIPLYARGFITRGGQVGSKWERAMGEQDGATGEGTLDYNLLPKLGSTEHHSRHLGTTHSFNPHTGEWLTYDSPASVRQKVEWLKWRGLAGCFFWELSGGHEGRKPPVERDLVAEGYAALFGGGKW